MDRSRSFNRFLATFSSLLLTGLLAAACDSGTQEPDAPEAPDSGSEYGAADPTPPSNPTRPSTPSGGSEDIASSRFPTDLPEGVTAAIPDNFPSDIPIYPGALPAQGKGVDMDGTPMSAVQLITNDAPGDVYDFYLNDLQRNGWTIGESPDIGSNSGIQATKGDCKASLLISPSSDGGSDIYVITEC